MLPTTELSFVRQSTRFLRYIQRPCHERSLFSGGRPLETTGKLPTSCPSDSHARSRHPWRGDRWALSLTEVDQEENREESRIIESPWVSDPDLSG